MAKRELLQLALEMLGTDGSLMCAEQPPLHERYNAMDIGQQLVASRIIRSGHSNLVLNKSFVAKGFVSFPAVCDYGTTQPTFLITKKNKLEAEKSIM